MVKESPLQGMQTGNVDSVSMKEIVGLHAIDLRCVPGSIAQAAIIDALGMDLFGKTGEIKMSTIAGGERVSFLGLAPDWWLVIGWANAEETLFPLKLNEEYHFSFVDVSGQRTTIEIEGPHAKDVLAHYWEQDLREKSFPVGNVSQGIMAKAPVVVCHISRNRYRIMVRASFAMHLWRSLEDAMVEWV